MYRASRVPTETLFLADLPDVGPSGRSGGPVWASAGPAVPWGSWGASGTLAGPFRGWYAPSSAPSLGWVLPAAGPVPGTAYAGRSGWPDPVQSPAGSRRSASPAIPIPDGGEQQLLLSSPVLKFLVLLRGHGELPRIPCLPQHLPQVDFPGELLMVPGKGQGKGQQVLQGRAGQAE